MTNKKKDFDFEQAFEQLEEIVNKLESGQETLREKFRII